MLLQYAYLLLFSRNQYWDMQEAFLHFVWRTGRFDHHRLLTTDGTQISILRRGIYQGNAGPDFSSAHLRLDNMLWHGHVEMHVYSSEWYRHRHHTDSAYDNTVLHVVWEEDEPVFRTDGTRLPCLELKQRVDRKLMARYQRLISDGNGIPCKFAIQDVPEITKRSMIDRVLIERIERKARHILHTLETMRGDWQETAWQHLAGGLGTPVNKEPMLRLTRHVPLTMLQKYRSNPLQIDALLFGMAGMLPDDTIDRYPQQLKAEFQFLKKKHNLQEMEESVWKFLRMRPIGFPTLRLAHLSAFARSGGSIVDNILTAAHPAEWMNSLDQHIHPYWTRHYRFGYPSPAKIKSLGRQVTDMISINVLVPILYAYGKNRGISVLQEKALHFLTLIPYENNAITRKWAPYGMPNTNAADSQAVLELQSSYCSLRKCIQCAIGCKVVSDIRQGVPLVNDIAFEEQYYQVLV